MYRITTIAFFALTISVSFAQTTEQTSPFVDAIEDNSFFIEEAYNQEDGVIQHISTLSYFSKPTKNVGYSFTEEIPVGSQTHQLSFTLPYLWLNGNTFNGIGDVLLNYRHQLSRGENWATVAPRVSLILPTGNNDNGLGSGVLGFQFNIPASKRLSNQFIIHANAGATILPNVKATTSLGREVKQTLTSYNLGISGIALVTQNFNLMLEVSENLLAEIDANGDVARTNETIISPGLRAAVDVNQLQIVPGIAIPMSFSEGEQRTGVFFYLSFEHPW